MSFYDTMLVNNSYNINNTLNPDIFIPSLLPKESQSQILPICRQDKFRVFMIKHYESLPLSPKTWKPVLAHVQLIIALPIVRFICSGAPLQTKEGSEINDVLEWG